MANSNSIQSRKDEIMGMFERMKPHEKTLMLTFISELKNKRPSGESIKPTA
jgi:hypothetical protein